MCVVCRRARHLHTNNKTYIHCTGVRLCVSWMVSNIFMNFFLLLCMNYCIVSFFNVAKTIKTNVMYRGEFALAFCCVKLINSDYLDHDLFICWFYIAERYAFYVCGLWMIQTTLQIDVIWNKWNYHPSKPLLTIQCEYRLNDEMKLVPLKYYTHIFIFFALKCVTLWNERNQWNIWSCTNDR